MKRIGKHLAMRQRPDGEDIIFPPVSPINGLFGSHRAAEQQTLTPHPRKGDQP